MSKVFAGMMSPVETFAPMVLTAGNSRFPQDVDAEFICIESADEPIDVFINKSTRPMKMSANDFFRMPEQNGEQTRFTHFEIRRRSGAAVAANSVVITVGSGEYRRGTTTVTANVTESRPAELVTPPDVVLVAATNTLIFAASADAVRRRIRNTSTTQSVRVSTDQASLTAGAGEIIGPEEVLETAVTGEIYARSAGTPTLNLSEETF